MSLIVALQVSQPSLETGKHTVALQVSQPSIETKEKYTAALHVPQATPRSKAAYCTSFNRMKPAGSASLSRKADTALRKASVAAKAPRLRSQAIDNAEVAKVITSTLAKVRSTTRDRDRHAIRFASKTIALRYSNSSGLARPDVKSFTILTERANFRTLQHFHTWGVPDEAIFQGNFRIPLPSRRPAE
ncbi:uncharacterized protein LMH87_007616 [Akanthomyces muscarius]|uniref:Uncharacterized protein n=1 Tax=Akanthomyces muscarius TaxID=2231603 RepID=A0A9W8QMI1_AKAMU|nr:uncharacterized protein LMH87_007616 [Akanthomyces muscarius]KAJ4161585.1 hypothetical protein LMH87_007616 [Akanthomyces muscarius]